jgi:hypothetical protein
VSIYKVRKIRRRPRSNPDWFGTDVANFMILWTSGWFKPQILIEGRRV